MRGHADVLRYAVLLIALMSQASCASHALSIALVNGTDDEIAVRDQLERLQERYDLEPYLFTYKVHVDRTQVPHSHPVLTLHTRHAGENDLLLSTFLHEQIHWYLSGRLMQVNAAIAELQRLYPQVPAGFPEGARNARSSYLHLIVNQLEYHALADVIGKERADAAFEFWRDDHYTWIYQKIFEDGRAIDALLARHNLNWADRNPRRSD
ncbi:MAG TPA: hypothetical protein VF275_12295 [Gammaproteobacteria bacterium]